MFLAAAACSSAPSAPDAQEPNPPSLLGQWRISTLNGRTAIVGRDGKPPVLTFEQHGYGGYAGCNAFGGLGFAYEGRFYGGFALSTAMACGAPSDEQERGVQRLMGSGPSIEWFGPDRLALTVAGQRLELARTGPLPANRYIVAPAPLIGTAWSFGALDGRAIEMPGARAGPSLTVEGDRFTLETPCLTTEGSWTQTGSGTAALKPERRALRTCNPASRKQSEAWSQAMRGSLRYGNGPNGEVVCAGGGHWMVGDRIRRGSSSEAAALAGRYEVAGGSTPAQRNSAKPAELILTRNAYYLWDGCNRTEGLAIPFERQLFLQSSGLTTLANCSPGRTDARFKDIVFAEPRIGRIAGGLVLSSPAGAIRLRRTGNAPPGTGGVTTGLLPGMRLTLLGEGGTLAILSGSRFRLTQLCGVTEGRWRVSPNELDGAVRFGPEGPAEACERDPAARHVQRVFLGNVDVAIGPNRDIALFAGRFGAVRARFER